MGGANAEDEMPQLFLHPRHQALTPLLFETTLTCSSVSHVGQVRAEKSAGVSSAVAVGSAAGSPEGFLILLTTFASR